MEGWRCEDLHERQIGLGVGALNHVIKISHRLMRVNEQDKLKFRHSGLAERYQHNLNSRMYSNALGRMSHTNNQHISSDGVGAVMVSCFGADVQAAQMLERTSDAPANCVSRSCRRVIARFREASATRAGA